MNHLHEAIHAEKKKRQVSHGLQPQSLWRIHTVAVGPRPTAAIPMENPYCSCRLTRVSAAPRSRRRPSSLGTSAACTPPWLVRAVGGAPTQRPFCPPTNAMFTGNQTPYFAANQRHLLPPTSAICYRRPTPHCAADQRHVNSSPPTGEQGLSPGDMPDPAKFAQFAASVDFTGGMNLPPTWNYPRTRWP